jgi:hypothetical protein
MPQLNHDDDENLTRAQRASKERDRVRKEMQAKKREEEKAKREAKKATKRETDGSLAPGGTTARNAGKTAARAGVVGSSGEARGVGGKAVSGKRTSEAPVKKVATKAMRKVKPATKKPTVKQAAAKSGVHQKTAVTPIISGQLQQAFDYFNGAMWDGKLPHVVLLFARKPRSYGYFWPKRWGKDNAGEVHEIALNPDHMRNEKDAKAALSTIVHEMCHLWQFVSGEKCPKRPYHNKEFSTEMERVGLITSSTGMEGGKRTGQKMTHYIEKGGAFDKAADQLIRGGFHFDWASFPIENTNSATAGKRVKYVCGGCDAAAWGKAELHIECSDCEEKMEAQ